VTAAVIGGIAISLAAVALGCCAHSPASLGYPMPPLFT
jgi:hypothetical protein